MRVDCIRDGMSLVSDDPLNDFFVHALRGKKRHAGMAGVVGAVGIHVQPFHQRFPVIEIIICVGKVPALRRGNQIFAVVFLHPVLKKGQNLSGNGDPPDACLGLGAGNVKPLLRQIDVFFF